MCVAGPRASARGIARLENRILALFLQLLPIAWKVPLVRIGIVIHRFDHRRGGAESWTCDFAKWLSESCDVHVIAREVSNIDTVPGISFHVVDSRSKQQFARQATEVIARLQLDVTHDMGCGIAADLIHPHAGCPPAVSERKREIPSAIGPRAVRLVRRLFSSRFAVGRARHQIANTQSLFLMVSQMVARDYEKHFGLPPERQRVVYNGVDLEYFRYSETMRHAFRNELSVGEEELLLLFVGNNFRLKGLPNLLSASAQLIESGIPVRLCVVGKEKATSWSQVARGLKINHTVTFHQDVDDVRPFYAAADVFVLPTYCDSCSLSALEAMACDLPVVTTRQNGVSELLTHGRNAWILESPSEIEPIVDAITQLSNEYTRARISQAAQDTISQHSIEDNFRRVFAVYQEIMNSRLAGSDKHAFTRPQVAGFSQESVSSRAA